MAPLAARLWRPPKSWPISIKVPALAALLMILVGTLFTNQVLHRFDATQQKHLRELSSAYLDGLSAAILPHLLHRDTWEICDALARAAHGYRGLDLVWTTVAREDGTVLASSDPGLFPVDSRLSEPMIIRFSDGADQIVSAAGSRAHLGRRLVHQGRAVGGIYAEIGIARLAAERRDVLVSLIATNTAVIFVLATLGYVAVRRMMKPIATLTAYLGRGRTGSPERIPDHHAPDPESEFGRLFSAYNRMASAIDERETMAIRLAEEEKLGSLGRLSSAIAHEINNPLGGLFNALDALKRHGDKERVRQTSISLLERGLQGIRDVVRSALHVYRTDEARRSLGPVDLEDLRLLIKPELKRRRQALRWQNTLTSETSLPAVAVRDMALNLLLNACKATQDGGTVSFAARIGDDGLRFCVADEGGGMPEKTKRYLEATSAAGAPIEDRAGLGLWMIRRLIDECDGTIAVEAAEERGTRVSVFLPIASDERMRHVA